MLSRLMIHASSTTFLTFAIYLVTGCSNQNEKIKSYVSLNGNEYNLRLSKASVKSQRVYAIVKSNSEISPNDSILLLSIGYKNGVERTRRCYSYMPAFPGLDDYSRTSVDFHDIFEIPFDYKSLCSISRYGYDSLGQLRIQTDSMDWKRAYEYRFRSGQMGKDDIIVGSEKDRIVSYNIKFFNTSGRDSLIKQFDGYLNGGVLVWKNYEWINDSTYNIRSTLFDPDRKNENAKTAGEFKGELVLVNKSNRNNKIIYSEQYCSPMDNNYNLHYSNFNKFPDVVQKENILEPHLYVSIYFNKAYSTEGIYDSTITECDSKDSVLLKMQYHGNKVRADLPVRDLKLAMTTSFKRNSRGLLISKTEDNHIMGGTTKSFYKYDFKDSNLLRKEEIIEWSSERGEIEGSKTILSKYDLAGNIVEEITSRKKNDEAVKEELRIVNSYDSKGNKTKEQTYNDGVLNMTKEWKFDNNDLLSDYVVTDRNGKIKQRLVWKYAYNKK